MAKKLSSEISAVRKRMKRRIAKAEKNLAGMASKTTERYKALQAEIKSYKEALGATYKFDPNTGKKVEGYSPSKRAQAIENLISVTARANKLVDKKLNMQITEQTRIELNRASVGAPSKYTQAEQNIFYQKTKNLWEGATNVKERNQLILKNGGYNNLQEAVEDILGATEQDIIKAYEIAQHPDKYSEEEVKQARKLLYDNFDAQQVSPPTRKQSGNIPERPMTSI